MCVCVCANSLCLKLINYSIIHFDIRLYIWTSIKIIATDIPETEPKPKVRLSKENEALRRAHKRYYEKVKEERTQRTYTIKHGEKLKLMKT